jgi:hypothetical protein
MYRRAICSDQCAVFFIIDRSECGGTALGKEVSRIQLHERRHTKTAYRAESGGPVQKADTGTDEPEPRCEHRKNGRGTIPLSTGMDRLFRQV